MVHLKLLDHFRFRVAIPFFWVHSCYKLAGEWTKILSIRANNQKKKSWIQESIGMLWNETRERLRTLFVLVTGKKRIVGSVNLLINLSWCFTDPRFSDPYLKQWNNQVKAKKLLKERCESKRDAIAIDHTKWIALYVYKNMNIIFWGRIIYFKFMEFLPSIIQSKGHQYVIIMFIDIHRCNLLLNIHKYMTHVYIIYDIYIYICIYVTCVYIYIYMLHWYY